MGELQAQLGFIKQSRSSSSHAEWQSRCMRKINMIRYGAGEIFSDDRVSLKSTLCRIVDLFISCSTETEDAVADFESGDSHAYSGYFAGHVVAEDKRVFQVCVHDVSAGLDQRVDWVDGHRAIAEDDLSGGGIWKGCFFYFEGLGVLEWL